MTLLAGCANSSRIRSKKAGRIDLIERLALAAVSALGRQERMSNAMDDANITYAIHIATTFEKLWAALTSPEALKNNWGRIESEWTVGSTVTEVDDSGKLLWKGEVLRSEPPRLLSYTFNVSGSGEPPTAVTFALSPPVSEVAQNEQIVLLTITHVGFQENSKLFPGCKRAWPEILSSVKTYLETGRPLRFAWRH
jgi:uncharacterized protein YndB with AHSA1/START domain